jgi:TatD DNase family protein
MACRSITSATHKSIRSTEEVVRHKVDTLIDVWCEAPVDARWEEVANSAVEQEQRDVLWGGVDYWFVMGTFHTRHLYGTVRLTPRTSGVHP